MTETDTSFKTVNAVSIELSEKIDIQTKKTNANWIKHGFFEFCSNTTVHGVRYFSERRRHWSERIWWIISFTLSLFLCGFFIRNIWIKWEQSPVIITFADKLTPVWAIPFPAVTICPTTRTNVEKLNITDAFIKLLENGSAANISKETITRMEALAQTCGAIFVDDFISRSNFTDGSIYHIIGELAPSFKDIMVSCKWRNKKNDCSEIFQPILAEAGICYTFNVLNSRDIYTEQMAPSKITLTNNKNATHWNLEDGYNDSKGNGTETYPYRVFGAGVRAGLFTRLSLYEKDLEYLCHGPLQGFIILLHTPGEVPQVSKHYFRVPLLQEVIVSVTPHMITTSESLRGVEPNRRQCYFNSERQLRFFKVYTQRNCELECLSNFTKIECGCVKFSSPRDRDTNICGVAKIKCFKEAEDKLLEKAFTERQNWCNCLPACTSISYAAEITQAKFDWIRYSNKRKLSVSAGKQLAQLSISFKENQFISSRRSELYGQADFIANCGGLLGLFMGVSVLSIIEILYHLTLRLCCTIRTRTWQENRDVAVRPGKETVLSVEIDIPSENAVDQ